MGECPVVVFKGEVLTCSVGKPDADAHADLFLGPSILVLHRTLQVGHSVPANGKARSMVPYSHCTVDRGECIFDFWLSRISVFFQLSDTTQGDMTLDPFLYVHLAEHAPVHNGVLLTLVDLKIAPSLIPRYPSYNDTAAACLVMPCTASISQRSCRVPGRPSTW